MVFSKPVGFATMRKYFPHANIQAGNPGDHHRGMNYVNKEGIVFEVPFERKVVTDSDYNKIHDLVRLWSDKAVESVTVGNYDINWTNVRRQAFLYSLKQGRTVRPSKRDLPRPAPALSEQGDVRNAFVGNDAGIF